MTPEVVSGIVGIVVSAAFEYIPGLHQWFNGIANNYQRLVMLGTLAVVIGVAFGLGCAGVLGPYWECTQQGGLEAVKLFVTAGVVNQATYLLLPKQNGS